MEIAYVVHSERCALLLDGSGVCRWVVVKVDDAATSKAAQRCLGAQFVATLDPAVEGMLGREPEVGKNVLFARVDEGRIALVRFGPLVRLERCDEQVDTLDAARELSRDSLDSRERPSETTIERPPTRVALDDFDDFETAVGDSIRRSGFMIRTHVADPQDADGATLRFRRDDDDDADGTIERPPATRRVAPPPRLVRVGRGMLPRHR